MLPGSRDKTYVATDRLNLSHVVHWQDMLRCLWRGQHDSINLRVPAFACQRTSGWDMDKSSFGRIRQNSASQQQLAIPLRFACGTVVSAVTVYWDPASLAAGLTMRFKSIALADGAITSHTSVASSSTAYHSRSMSPGVLLTSDEAYFVEVDANDQNSTVAGFVLSFERAGRTTPP
jgi:hypothetical protein